MDRCHEDGSIISFNGVFADREDNIFFLHNSSSPLRKEGIDWKNVIDGTRSDLVWNDVDFEEIPQIRNPSSGWIASTNQDQYKVTDANDNLNLLTTLLLSDYRLE